MHIKPTIQIAHRSPLLCEVLREALENRHYNVLCYTTTGPDTLQKLNIYRPNIIILSNGLEGKSGIEIAEEMTNTTTACLFLSQTAAEAHAVNERIEPLGHLPAYVNMSELFYAINEIVNNRRYMSSYINQLLFEPPTKKALINNDAAFLQLLTKREIEIMKALAESYTTPQIADKLYISNATVNNHRANIIQKLDLKGRNQLMSVAIALKPFYMAA